MCFSHLYRVECWQSNTKSERFLVVYIQYWQNMKDLNIHMQKIMFCVPVSWEKVQEEI